MNFIKENYFYAEFKINKDFFEIFKESIEAKIIKK